MKILIFSFALFIFYHPARAELILAENFDDQTNWQTPIVTNVNNLADSADVPPGWDDVYSSETWHPNTTPDSNPNFEIRGDNPDMVKDRVGKSLVTWTESLYPGDWSSDGQIFKDITPSNTVYVEFDIKFQPEWAGASGIDQGHIKVFRILHLDEGGTRTPYFKNGDSGPIYLFGWKQDSYGIRHVHSFRGDPQETNYKMALAPPLDVPRYANGATSANFTGDIAHFPNTIRDLVNGGTIPTDGSLIYHDQVYGDLWHKMRFYLVLNSAPGVQDGVLKVWIDEHPIMDASQIAWVGPGGDINAKWNSIALGGNDYYWFDGKDDYTWTPDKERWYAFDNIKIYDSMPNRPLPPYVIGTQ